MALRAEGSSSHLERGRAWRLAANDVIEAGINFLLMMAIDARLRGEGERSGEAAGVWRCSEK